MGYMSLPLWLSVFTCEMRFGLGLQVHFQFHQNCDLWNVIEGHVLILYSMIVTRSLWVPLYHSVIVTILNSENLIWGPRGSLYPPIPPNSVSTQNLAFPPIVITSLYVARLYIWFHVPDSPLCLIPQVPTWRSSVRTLVSSQPQVSLYDGRDAFTAQWLSLSLYFAGSLGWRCQFDHLSTTSYFITVSVFSVVKYA